MINNIIAKTFIDMADMLETGSIKSRNTIALTGLGSELGEEVVIKAAQIATQNGLKIVYIGTQKCEYFECIYANCDADAHEVMDNLINDGKIQGAVTMHYPFPIGMATVGRIEAPATGLPFYIASTTGTTSSNRVEAMVKNAINGLAVAKICGNKNPSLGILNLDGAKQCEGILRALNSAGYEINFAVSKRADKGSILRGNDLLQGSADVLVCDSLTGNILMKTLSAYATGGNVEAVGWGYGPAVGEGAKLSILIVSRASGTAVIANALQYAYELAGGDFEKTIAGEYKKAKAAGLDEALKTLKEKSANPNEQVVKPPKEVVTAEIMGIDVMDIEEAVQSLWKFNIYAESGMGCTGPILMVSEANLVKAKEILVKNSYIQN
ncbi:MAG: glycine reductase [Christensenellaceae bacterium]|nr:glycine reductase [Christensenellaceae bacterium]